MGEEERFGGGRWRRTSGEKQRRPGAGQRLGRARDQLPHPTRPHLTDDRHDPKTSHLRRRAPVVRARPHRRARLPARTPQKTRHARFLPHLAPVRDTTTANKLTRRKGSGGACLLLLLLAALAGERSLPKGRKQARADRARRRARETPPTDSARSRLSFQKPTATTAATAAATTAAARSLDPSHLRALLGRDSGGGPSSYPGGASSSVPALPLLQVFGVTLMSFGSLCILGYIAWRAFEWYQRKAAGYVEMTSWG